jgi:hypothetical protein
LITYAVSVNMNHRVEMQLTVRFIPPKHAPFWKT